jgi:hypothetical protein
LKVSLQPKAVSAVAGMLSGSIHALGATSATVLHIRHSPAIAEIKSSQCWIKRYPSQQYATMSVPEDLPFVLYFLSGKFIIFHNCHFHQNRKQFPEKGNFWATHLLKYDGSKKYHIHPALLIGMFFVIQINHQPSTH